MVSLVNYRLWEYNGYPMPPLLAVCDGHQHEVTALVLAMADPGRERGRFRTGAAVHAGASLVAKEDIEPFPEKIASDWRLEYVGGVPARCLPVPGLVTPV